jgi:hypothetical protein
VERQGLATWRTLAKNKLNKIQRQLDNAGRNIIL